MSSPVYFASVRARGDAESKMMKVRRLFDAAGFPDCIDPFDLVAIKIHFGERGSDAFINPVFARQVVDRIHALGGKPFLTDTRTLYKGGRSNAIDHMTIAYEHGFTFATVNAPVHIADGLGGRRGSNVVVNLRHFKAVSIAAGVVDANAMIALSHFNGHDVAGFGGAIKNIAMGCATQAGKQQQHAVKTMVRPENCEGCGRCISVCPTGALSRGMDGKTEIDKKRCIGCFDCMNVCNTHGVDIDWEADAGPFLERMAEHAYGTLKGKEGKSGFMNFLINITPDCDCVPWSDAPIVPDIGIVASKDPVAIDAASFDLVNRQMGLACSLLEENLEPGADKFKGLRCLTDGCRQLRYAEEIGLGTQQYELIEI